MSATAKIPGGKPLGHDPGADHRGREQQRAQALCGETAKHDFRLPSSRLLSDRAQFLAQRHLIEDAIGN
jgi:hypothetical protein